MGRGGPRHPQEMYHTLKFSSSLCVLLTVCEAFKSLKKKVSWAAKRKMVVV